MGRKAPAAFRDAVTAFLEQAARAYETTDCWLSCSVADTDAAGSAFIREFVARNDVPPDLATRAGLTYVSHETFDRCLAWLISNRNLLPRRSERPNGLHFSMSRTRQIHGWITGSPSDSAEVGGLLHEAYGTVQYLGTELTFRSMEEYRWVSSVARNTLGIRMNDKHLRPRTAVAG
jgi:hypothetical protein